MTTPTPPTYAAPLPSTTNRTSTTTIHHPIHAKQHPPPAPIPAVHPAVSTTIMGAPTTGAAPNAVVSSSSWSYTPVPPAPSATHAAPPVYTAAPPPGAAPSTASPPQSIPPPPVHMQPGPPIQHPHPHAHPLYHSHPHPHPQRVIHHPNSLSPPIAHPYPPIPSPEYIHNGTTAAMTPVVPAVAPSATATAAAVSSTAATAFYQQRTKLLEEELVAARREIDYLMSRLAQVEKDRKTKETPSTTTSTKGQSRYWTQDEHMKFLEALEKFGQKDVRSIAAYVGTRNATQVRTHAQKYFLRVRRQNQQGDGAGSTRRRSMSEGDLTRMGGRAKSPPGSPVVDDVRRELGAAAAAGLNGRVAGGRIAKRERGVSPARKIASPPSSSGGKPPVVRGSTASAVAAAAAGNGVPVSCGINLLSIVASERKEAMSRSAALPPKGAKETEKRGVDVGDTEDTEMRDA